MFRNSISIIHHQLAAYRSSKLVGTLNICRNFASERKYEDHMRRRQKEASRKEGTLLFRTFNPELFVRPSPNVIALSQIGSAIFLICMAKSIYDVYYVESEDNKKLKTWKRKKKNKKEVLSKEIEEY